MNILIASDEYTVCELFQLFKDGNHKIFQATTTEQTMHILINETIAIAFVDTSSEIGPFLASLAKNKGVKVVSCGNFTPESKVCMRTYGKMICEHCVCSIA